VLAKAKRHACPKRAVNAVNAAQNVMPFCLFALMGNMRHLIMREIEKERKKTLGFVRGGLRLRRDLLHLNKYSLN
jgi:hypothetical protein